MSKEIISLDTSTLSVVTGGTHRGGGDPLLNDLGNLASQIKDITAKTSGFSSTQMLLLCAVALQRQNNGLFGGGQNTVVYYAGPRRWW